MVTYYSVFGLNSVWIWQVVKTPNGVAPDMRQQLLSLRFQQQTNGRAREQFPRSVYLKFLVAVH